MLEHWAGFDLGGAPFLNALGIRERRIHLKAQGRTFSAERLRQMIEDLDMNSIYYETVRDLAKFCHVHSDTRTACFFDAVSGEFINPSGEECHDKSSTGSMEARYGRGEEVSSEETRSKGQGSPRGGKAGGAKATGNSKTKPRKGSQGNRNRSGGKVKDQAPDRTPEGRADGS